MAPKAGFTRSAVNRLYLKQGNKSVSGSPIPVGKYPVGVAVSEGAVWVTKAGDNTVSKIDMICIDPPFDVGADFTCRSPLY